jgi:molybdate transport system ATP-binding protein
VSSHRRRIGMVAQQPALFPHMTVRENVQFAGSAPDALLERFHVEHLAGRRPMEISGGEKQRVAIARAVAARPRLLLLDEALSGLQDTLRATVLAELKAWQRETGTPVLAVTHDPAEAASSADEVLRLDEGRVVARGPARQVLAPELGRLRVALEE